MTLLYLDQCSLQRPFDDQSQPRIAEETAAVEKVLAHVEAGGAALVASSALSEESANNPHETRRAFVDDLLADAEVVIEASAVTVMSAALEATGIRTMDATHVACAVAARADYFCTCDDRLLRRARAAVTPPPRIVSPLELVEELGL